MEDMVNAIRTDRVVDMVKYFDNFVPITINNNQQIYSHNQAQVVLQDFFDKNSAKDFVIMDNGSPDNTSKFLIGSFTEPNGTKYSVYVLMKTKTGDYMLQELRDFVHIVLHLFIFLQLCLRANTPAFYIVPRPV